MVKAKKKKKRVKEKATHSMFARGGLDLLLVGGFIALFYQTLYILISMESQIKEISYPFFVQFFKDVGFFFLFVTVVCVCVFYLKKVEFFQKHAGSFLVAGTVLSVPAAIYSLYMVIDSMRDQTITLQSYAAGELPLIAGSLSKLYIFAGAFLLGIYLWGYRGTRKWASQLFVGGTAVGCAFVAASIYSTYENTKIFLEMYSTSRDLIISRLLFPEMLKLSSWLLIIIGVLFFSASYIFTERFQKWAGRAWVFGGIAGTFQEFLQLSLDSEVVRSEITSVRQSIMELTPYASSLKNLPLTVETMKEFYIKKMIPLYLEHSFWILIFAGIAVLGIYFWMKE
ncbi:MAG: hypothetical protein HXS44_05600 [Theionarchaea archaeon]|nr:hypothetical protein [Theionarchaea archaeon]